MFVQGIEASEEEVEQANELAASTNLNMSICFFLLQDYKKALEKAKAKQGGTRRRRWTRSTRSTRRR